MDKQNQKETVGQALVEFTEFIKTLNEREENNTEFMQSLESDEDIRAGVKKWIEIRKKRGFLYK